MTYPQKRELERAAKAHDGIIRWIGVRGFQRNQWLKMMDRVCAKGYVTALVDDGFAITQSGRDALNN